MAAAEPAALGPRSASAVLASGSTGPAAAAGGAPARTLEDQLHDAGLNPLGACGRLSDYGDELLRTSPMLQDLTVAEADILCASMLLVRAEPGQVLIREGDFGDWMMVLLKGTVDVTKRVAARGEAAPADGAGLEQPQGEAVTSRLAVIQRGAAVGDMSMLDSEPRYASCVAIEAVEAGVLGRHAIALLIRDHPAVGAKLLVKITQLMAQRLRNTSNQLVRLMAARQG